MKYMYLGITDSSWINFMKKHEEQIGEYINFWTPGSKEFKALEPGELFLFKRHAKKAKGENGEIVGGAYFWGFEKMKPAEAWARFGLGNGSENLFEMQVLINEMRGRNNLDDTEEIGCIILHKPFFLGESQWIESPEDWGKSIVSGKKYDISVGNGKEIYNKIVQVLAKEGKEEIIDINIAIKQFEKEKMEEAKERVVKAEALRQKFVSDFPIESIQKLSLEEYIIAPKGTGYDNSFCRRVRYELEGLAHMGNAFPQVFGLYLKNGESVELSHTLKKEYENNIDAAFDSLKKQIVDLLLAAKENDYAAISNCKLNSLFKSKLLLIYYPDKFFPVCAKDVLQAYCKVVGLEFPDNEEMIYKNIALLEWKNNNYPFCEWGNALFMLFCDWIWRENKKLNFENLKKAYSVAAKQIDEELQELRLEGQDRDALVKVRVNQGVFRKKLLDKYKKCCLCHVQNKELLIASHIKPWSACEPSEKLDPNNGFLLCPNHDRLFDGGWISFEDTGNIIIADEIELVDRINTNVFETMKIEVNEENQKYLKYHRENVLRK